VKPLLDYAKRVKRWISGSEWELVMGKVAAVIWEWLLLGATTALAVNVFPLNSGRRTDSVERLS